jgi:hypothetical protein
MNKGYALSLVLISLIALSTTVSQPVKADSQAPQLQWSKTYGPYEGYSVIQTDDGGYVISGVNATNFGHGYDLTLPILIKTDSSGNLQWERTYQDYDIHLEATRVMQTKDGGYLISGPYTNSAEFSWLIKTDAQGNVQWNMTNSAGFAYTPVLETKEGNGYLIVGKNGWLLRTNTQGNVQWNKTLYDSTIVGQVIRTSDGNFVVSGVVGNSLGGSNGMLMKADDKGNVLWVQVFGPKEASSNIGNGLVVETNGGYTSAGSWNHLYWVVKTDYNGNLVFNKTYGLTPSVGVGFTLMTKSSDGGCLITGGSGEYSLLMKLDSEGNTLWSKYYSLSGDFVWGIRSMTPTYDGGCAATTVNTIMKVDAFGNVQWNQTFSGNLNFVALTNDSGLAVTGQLNNSIWAVKFAPESSMSPSLLSTPSPSIPEFPSWIILPLVLIFTLSTILLINERWKRRLRTSV